MRGLLIKRFDSWCEDCCDGITRGLSSLIYITAAYLKREGIALDVEEFESWDSNRFDGYHYLINFVSLGNLQKDLPIMQEAKERGLRTILIMHDSFWVEEEIMEEFKFIDFCIVYPEREVTLKELIQSIISGDNKCIPGTIYRRGKDILRSPVRDAAVDLAHLKSSALELKRILPGKYNAPPYLTIGRGCNYGCNFCDIRRTKVRKRMPEDILDELKVYQQYGNTKNKISFIDPFFAANKAWTQELCQLIVKENIVTTWRITTRYDSVFNETLVALWKKAGCYNVSMGLEQLNNSQLKPVQLDKFKQAVKVLQKYDILPTVSIIIGLWEDNHQNLELLREFLVSLGKIIVIVTPFMPLKNTPLYSIYRDHGLFRSLTYKEYRAWGYAKFLFPTKYLSIDELYIWMDRLRKIG